MITDERLKGVLTHIVEVIKTKYNPQKIILYGSYAYGNPNENSDIDLLIIKETSDRPIDRRVKVRRIVDIKDSFCPAFSPVVLTLKEIEKRKEIGDQIIEEILTKGEILYVQQ